MEPFVTLEARALPLPAVNIDTDQIIPARFLARSRPEQAEALFRDLRVDGAGRTRGFVMDRPEFAGARIVVAGSNFGCGSSRESAVTALVDNGFRAFVAPSFGDIFFNNCFQNGVLPIRLPEPRIAAMLACLEAQPGARLRIDLSAQTIQGPDERLDNFEIDGFRKDCLLRGVDVIDLTLAHRDQVAAFEAKQARELPWLDAPAPGR